MLALNKDSRSNKRFGRKRRVRTAMAVKQEVIEIDDSSPSPVRKSTPLRPILCLKNREDIKKYEEDEDCFILEFDPYNDLGLPCAENDEAELIVVGEKGQVACRDYPHPRNTCAKFPFEKTPHPSHCELCYCYVCDTSAPCPKWTGSNGHCDAFDNAAWNSEKQTKRSITKDVYL